MSRIGDEVRMINLGRIELEAAGICPDTGLALAVCSQTSECDCGLKGATPEHVEEYRAAIAVDLEAIRQARAH